ncbi:uncharacterized protein YlxW (UPF0749 family) [Anaerobacterium chartisolvens]|uniref:Uncharacterized protein YlxW (UPF0749 family) n=1 Tax=Anaerobacterium chartisolvens TaxID=1297424 RepID=A0A369B2C0_9FIRM|nr:DUF881 domain-containing protein [Anaerobacterium chartisolvens]RCX13854.1 uncharacterized protein YlxW (UPF0749 family) [Anaerobacterium chartisolvens]
MKVKTYTNVALALVCILLGTMLALQFKSINYNQKIASTNNKRLEDLNDELIALRKTNDGLVKRNEELKAENMEYEKTRGNISGETEALKNELDRVRIIAGLVDVKGKGLIITIHAEDSYVSDTDILSVLNELRASDVQAISVNEERIVAMSEVRVAGNYIMINQTQMRAPFVIKAIAEPEKVEHTLRIIDGVVETLENYGLKVKIEKADQIIIPKVRDDGSVFKTNLLQPVK